MTAEGESSRAARPWHALRGLSNRTSLRTKLLAALLALVTFALAAMGIAGVSLLRGYLIGPTDTVLKNVGLQQAVLSAVGGDPRDQGQLGVAGYAIWWVPDQGAPQSVVQPSPAAFGMNQGNNVLPAQSLTSVQSWLSANPDIPTTVPGQAAGDRWRIIGIGGATLNGASGTVAFGLDVSTAYTTIGELTGVDVIVSVVIVFVLAIVGFAVVQANLRPLVDIEETAGEIAAGHLNRRVPERDPRTEIGRLGQSLNTMLSQIETGYHAREQSEAAAHQSEERMRRFIADASHELRTPLTAIRGFAEYYRQRGGLVRRWDRDHATADSGAGADAGGTGLTPDDLDRIMQRVEKEAARMGLLVEDLLLLARLDQQRPLARQPVDLLLLAADAVGDARLLAPSRAVDLSVQPGAAFLVIGDEARLRQVIGNLMSNALTHTPDGTPIEVSIGSGILDPHAGDHTPAVLLDVTDHGPGMTPEQAHRVFERFYRADQARTRTTGGNGLGLAIVRALVAAQGGVTSVRTAEGQGATFRIALPLAPEALDHPDDTDLAEDADLADDTDLAEDADPADDADLAEDADPADDREAVDGISRDMRR
jgi:two-component system, OmpR family, sensor kinase